MDGFDPDRELERLRGAAERIGANLLELDQDPSRALLDAASLQGASAARWDGARLELAGLFLSYAALTAVLDRAATVRGTHSAAPASREAELAALLIGPSIELSDTVVPLADRDLLSGSRLIERCTPDELVGRMSSAYDEVRHVVVAAGDVWEVLVPRVRSARERLVTLTELATQLDRPVPPDLVGLDEELDALGRDVMGDPLSVDAARVDRIDERLGSVASELAAMSLARDELPHRIEAARRLLVQLQDEVEEGRRLASETAAKIEGREAPGAIVLDPEVAEQLQRIVERAEGDGWRSVANDLAAWQRSTDDLLQRAHDVAAVHSGLLRERNELRGRLDAYRAKAGHLHQLENPELLELYEQTRTVLYTAPCDLEMAAELLRQYQQALAALDDRRVAK